MTRFSIAIGADHGGVSLKSALIEALRTAGHTVTDLGTDGPASVDYPDYAAPVCKSVLDGSARFGVLVCGSGIGMSMAANRFRGIRCALIHDVTGARLTRAHNDANVIAFGARTTGVETALDALNVFLTTDYEGGRHDRRIAKIEDPA